MTEIQTIEFWRDQCAKATDELIASEQAKLLTEMQRDAAIEELKAFKAYVAARCGEWKQLLESLS